MRDGMAIEWDAPIPMDDGIVLRADVYHPIGEGKWPVILTYGPYAKGQSFADLNSTKFNPPDVSGWVPGMKILSSVVAT